MLRTTQTKRDESGTIARFEVLIAVSLDLMLMLHARNTQPKSPTSTHPSSRNLFFENTIEIRDDVPGCCRPLLSDWLSISLAQTIHTRLRCERRVIPPCLHLRAAKLGVLLLPEKSKVT
jgi:hypothetical protein